MLDNLKTLDARLFENLVYDLLTICGVRNLTWRTPGADGGRDVEGIYVTNDLSGELVAERWYFECKRYTASISWPKVFEKVAYATNQGADFLLLATTSSLSTQCLDEVTQWNAGRNRPLIRHWPGYRLVELIRDQPKLLAKYTLAAKPSQQQSALVHLSTQLAKATQSAYSAHEFGKGLTPTIELAAAPSELLNAIVDDLNKDRPFAAAQFNDIKTDGYSWATYAGSPCPVDRLVLRAILSTVKVATKTSNVSVTFAKDRLDVSRPPGTETNDSAKDLLTELSFWGNLEMHIEDAAFTFVTR